MKKGDKIVALIVLALVIISSLSVALYRFFNQGEALTAKIVQDQEVLEVIDLNKVDKPREWTIKGEDGEFNTIRVEKGRIRFIDANCPDLVCVNTGWLSQPGDIAVCVPYRVSIRIEGKEDEIDQISY